MQMHVDLCWFIIPWSSLMWPKDDLNMCHIFHYNFSVNFLQCTWIRPQKNLPNQDSWGDITCQSPSSKHYHFKRQGNVGQSVLSALSQWHDTIHLQEKGSKGVFVECYCDKALSTNYLTQQYLLKWSCLLDGDWQVMSPQESCFGRFFCGRFQVLWRKLTEKL